MTLLQGAAVDLSFLIGRVAGITKVVAPSDELGTKIVQQSMQSLAQPAGKLIEIIVSKLKEIQAYVSELADRDARVDAMKCVQSSLRFVRYWCRTVCSTASHSVFGICNSGPIVGRLRSLPSSKPA